MHTSNLWFIGTGNFAALCLEGLTRRGLTFTRIITGNPTRSGRNNRENPSAVEVKASEIGLTVTRTGKLSENHELINALTRENPPVIFVVDFGQIIREPFLSCMCLNIHPSLLPEYRGAAPIQRALLDGRTQTGVTVFRLAKSMDAGEILTQSAIHIDPSENASDLYTRLADVGCEIACTAMKNDELTFTAQNDSLATYAPKLEKEEFALTFTMTAEKFVNRVRALDMSGGAWVMAGGKRLKVWRACIIDGVKAKFPGEVVNVGEVVAVSCCDSCVGLMEVQSEGKKRMTAREWCAGLRLNAGATL